MGGGPAHHLQYQPWQQQPPPSRTPGTSWEPGVPQGLGPRPGLRAAKRRYLRPHIWTAADRLELAVLQIPREDWAWEASQLGPSCTRMPASC